MISPSPAGKTSKSAVLPNRPSSPAAPDASTSSISTYGVFGSPLDVTWRRLAAHAFLRPTPYSDSGVRLPVAQSIEYPFRPLRVILASGKHGC